MEMNRNVLQDGGWARNTTRTRKREVESERGEKKRIARAKDRYNIPDRKTKERWSSGCNLAIMLSANPLHPRHSSVSSFIKHLAGVICLMDLNLHLSLCFISPYYRVLKLIKHTRELSCVILNTIITCRSRRNNVRIFLSYYRHRLEWERLSWLIFFF